MRKVKILGTAITATHGTLVTGDVLNVDDKFAAHLVNDCRIAEYLDAAPAAQPEQEPEKPGKTKKPKAESAPETPAEQTDTPNTDTE